MIPSPPGEKHRLGRSVINHTVITPHYAVRRDGLDA